MAIVLENALLADLDPIRVEPGGLRIDAGNITERGARVSQTAADEVIDCAGAVVHPGLVNGHTHLYSALATGMPAPPKSPTNFRETLQYVWWRLDRAHDADSIEYSARIGALDALRCGTTTLIDHHASPSHIANSLDLIRDGLADAGVRGVLCYETTDRNGPDGAAAGLEENRRFASACQQQPDGRFAGLIGAHASFTVGDKTLADVAGLTKQLGVGVHVHVAEDPCDEDDCRSRHQVGLSERFASNGLLEPNAVLGHGTHLDDEAIKRVIDAGLSIAHCPRSNMNNSVGYAPVARFGDIVMLGTDGHGSDMFTEARIAWFIGQHEKAGLTPDDVLRMLAASARRASASLGVTLGKLEPGAVADVVVTDYRPATPMTSANLAGHFLWGMSAASVASVITGGRWAVRDRNVLTRDETADRRRALEVTNAFWDRLSGYGCD